MLKLIGQNDSWKRVQKYKFTNKSKVQEKLEVIVCINLTFVSSLCFILHKSVTELILFRHSLNEYIMLSPISFLCGYLRSQFEQYTYNLQDIKKTRWYVDESR